MADVENLSWATELRLGLPGSDSEMTETATAQLLKGAAGMMVITPPTTPRGSKRALVGGLEMSGREEEAAKTAAAAAPPAAKAQVVGWPPVRSYRKSCFQQASSKSKADPAPAPAPAKKQEETATATATAGLYVKVSMDGAPYLRKIDLKIYKGYRELREALEAMFLCFSGDNNSSSAAAAGAASVNPSDFAVTYEDKDGDLMLVGDVPFEMFMSTCKRLRIMKGSEARGLGGSSKE